MCTLDSGFYHPQTRAEVGLVLKKLRNFSPSRQTLCVEESLNLLDMKPPEEAEIASDGSQRSLNEEFGSKKSVDEGEGTFFWGGHYLIPLLN